MANLDWSRCPAVERDGMTIDEIVEQYPVSREEIKAVLDFAANSLDVAPGS